MMNYKTFKLKNNTMHFLYEIPKVRNNVYRCNFVVSLFYNNNCYCLITLMH